MTPWQENQVVQTLLESSPLGTLLPYICSNIGFRSCRLMVEGGNMGGYKTKHGCVGHSSPAPPSDCRSAADNY